MNQVIVFVSSHDYGQTDIVEFSEFASSNKNDLALINKWNEKVRSRDIAYH